MYMYMYMYMYSSLIVCLHVYRKNTFQVHTCTCVSEAVDIFCSIDMFSHSFLYCSALCRRVEPVGQVWWLLSQCLSPK